jgi:hypothetical protein
MGPTRESAGASHRLSPGRRRARRARRAGVAALALWVAGCGGSGGPLPTPVTPAGPTLRLETAHFQIWSDAPDDGLLRRVADLLEAERPRILSDLGLSSAPAITVKVWRDHEAWATAAALYFGRTISTTGYVTGAAEMRVLGLPQADQIALHEMAHCLSLVVNPTFGNNPRWLWESVAIYEAGERVDPRTVPALVAGQPPSLAQLDADVAASQLVYQVGYTIAEFVVARAGRDGLVALIRANGNTQAVLGLSPEAFVQEWYAFVRARYLS